MQAPLVSENKQQRKQSVFEKKNIFPRHHDFFANAKGRSQPK